MSRYRISLILAGVTGFISLSQEILWMRAVGYASGGAPTDFADVLGAFLLGIAAGAWLARQALRATEPRPMLFVSVMLLVGGIASYVSLPAAAHTYANFGDSTGSAVALVLVGVFAMLLGGIFPALCEFGIPRDGREGMSTAWLYLASIIGSTLGPLFTGFVLMDFLTLEQLFVVFGVLTCAVAAAGVFATKWARAPRWRFVGGAAAASVAMVVAAPSLYSHVLERLQFKNEYTSQSRYKTVIQTRSGIIATEDTAKGEVIYGGGLYDGKFNIDPFHDTNGIARAYMVPVLHPNPAEVLDIGMSGGSWARVLVDNELVKTLDVVEISRGYVELVQDHPESLAMLNSPKVTLHIDDGRRWLTRHPDRKFDFILMNTTFHWRSNITNLLSKEFLELCKAHLKKGGILFYNTTGSAEVYRTAAQVFNYTARVHHHVAVSDEPFDQDRDRKLANIRRYVRDGRPLFPPDDAEATKVANRYADMDTTDKREEMLADPDAREITDDNMASEFRRGPGWLNPDRTWASVFRQL